MSSRTPVEGEPGGTITPLIRDVAGPLALARGLADRSREPMLLTSGDGTVIYANAAAASLFGAAPPQLAGRDLRVLVPGCPGDLRSESGTRTWRVRIPALAGASTEMEVRLGALDPPRCSVLALVAAEPRPAIESDHAGVELERWALAAQGSTDGFWHRPDVGLDDAWWSPRLYEMLGYAPGEIAPRFTAIVERLHPQDRPRFLAERERHLLRGEPLDIEVRLRHRRGDYRRFRVRALVTRERDGHPVSLSGSFQDVTELHRAREALETNQARMRDLATAASDFFFEMDERFTITWLSDNFAQVTGIEPESLLGRDSASRRPAGNVADAEAWDRYVAVLERRAPFRDLVRSRLRPDGHIVYAALSGQPVFDEHGVFRGYRGSGTDVTARVMMENALRESEEKYRTIVETDHDAVLVVDACEHVVLDANTAATSLYGLDGKSLLGRSATTLAADSTSARGLLESVSDGGAARRQRDTHRHADGHTFPVEVSARRVRLSGRDAIVCMVRDVSEREQALAALEQSEARFKALIENAPFEIWLKDADGRYLFANPSVAAGWGKPVEEIIGRTVHDLFDAEFAGRSARQDREVMETNMPAVLEFTTRRQGQEREIYRVKFPIPDASGRAAGVGAISHDITDRRRDQAALELSERRFRDFADLAADYFWETDENLVYTFVSERCLEVNGIPAEEVLGRRALEVYEDNSDDDDLKVQHRADIAARRPTQMEWNRTRPDGSVVRVFVRTRPMFDGDGRFLGYRGITRDVTGPHEMAAQLAFQATHDALTGLVNRGEFERRLARLLESARTEGSSHALCYLDLDQFKVVNDTCGHMAGDALLERLAETLTFRVRQRDTVARLGGDEFGVLIEHCSVAQATRVASVLHQALSDFVFSWEDKQFQVGASVGLVPITPEWGDVADVLGAADSACYLAKDQGRNRIHVYSRDDAELTRRRGEMNWVSHISGALADDRFRLRAQPVVPLAPRRAGAHHCELLVMMVDRDGNEILPGAFLPAAERYNLATRIDRWVIRAALAWLADDRDNRGRPALTGINLSAQSLGEVDFLKYVRSECGRAQVPASRLCFEITETAAISNLDTARRFMNELKRDGARFALDDFGKGLSSFGYLRALPVDYIKIDAQFVRDLLTDPIDLAMVRAINDVARLMEKRTIAEGVESHETLAKLREVGVDYAQGFAIGAPRFID